MHVPKLYKSPNGKLYFKFMTRKIYIHNLTKKEIITFYQKLVKQYRAAKNKVKTRRRRKRRAGIKKTKVVTASGPVSSARGWDSNKLEKVEHELQKAKEDIKKQAEALEDVPLGLTDNRQYHVTYNPDDEEEVEAREVNRNEIRQLYGPIIEEVVEEIEDPPETPIVTASTETGRPRSFPTERSPEPVRHRRTEERFPETPKRPSWSSSSTGSTPTRDRERQDRLARASVLTSKPIILSSSSSSSSTRPAEARVASPADTSSSSSSRVIPSFDKYYSAERTRERRERIEQSDKEEAASHKAALEDLARERAEQDKIDVDEINTVLKKLEDKILQMSEKLINDRISKYQEDVKEAKANVSGRDAKAKAGRKVKEALFSAASVHAGHGASLSNAARILTKPELKIYSASQIEYFRQRLPPRTTVTEKFDSELRRRGLIGQGKGPNPGLYDDQIDSMMSKYPEYLGTISRDEIKTLLPKIQPQSRIAMILNTDKPNGEGIHWFAIFADARPEGSQSIEYFDSYGRSPSESELKDIKLISEMLRAQGYLKLKINKVVHQHDESSTCGWHAMRFLIDRLRGKTFAEATGYNPDAKIHGYEDKYEDQAERMKKNSSFNYV